MTTTTRERWTVQRAAQECGVHPLTIRRWIAAGRLPAHRVGVKLIRVYADDMVKMCAPVTSS